MAASLAQVEQPPVEAQRPELTVPVPEVEPPMQELVIPEPDPTTLVSAIALPTEPARPASVETLGPGLGTGGGPGAGSGSGGGVGTGRGSGVGSGIGPGSGGGDEVFVAPEPRAIIYPFEEPPASVKGRQFNIRFWVDALGRVTKVEIEPKIEDSAFRKALLERMRSWTFYPARTRSGRRVPGQLVITYEP